MAYITLPELSVQKSSHRGQIVSLHCSERVIKTTVLRGSKENPEEWLKPDDREPQTFIYIGPERIKFLPLCRIVDEEYNIYFNINLRCKLFYLIDHV